jgi:hypothetical protein
LLGGVLREEEAMKLALFTIASSLMIVCSPVCAEPANEGQPFGKGIVSEAARNKEIKGAVQENVPGGLDDVVHENLADDGDEGAIRGHGKTDAPGQN